MSEEKLKTMEDLFQKVSNLEGEYRHGLIKKGACVLEIEDAVAQVKMHDLQEASGIASEYKMKLVPVNWKQHVPED